MEFTGQALLSGFLQNAVPLAIWVAVLVYALVKTKKRRGKPERLFITGAAICLVAVILAFPSSGVLFWSYDNHMTNADRSLIMNIYNLVLAVIRAGGLICILYSFLVKFKQGNMLKKVTPKPD